MPAQSDVTGRGDGTDFYYIEATCMSIRLPNIEQVWWLRNPLRSPAFIPTVGLSSTQSISTTAHGRNRITYASLALPFTSVVAPPLLFVFLPTTTADAMNASDVVWWKRFLLGHEHEIIDIINNE